MVIEKFKMDNSSGTNKAVPTGSTNLTSETMRLELIEADRANHSQDFPQMQENILSSSSSQSQKKKPPTFQITSVVFNPHPDAGEESPDETEEMSDIVDSSKMMSDIEQETPSFSEEYSKSEDVGAPVTVIPTSSQYGITAVVQQNESGGLLTSRLPQGITVNVTTGGIAIAEAEGGVTGNDTENLSSRFKIVKIASNKPFKKGRWVCFDFMDSPTSSAIGIRNTDISHSVSIPLATGGVAKQAKTQPLPQLQQISQTVTQPQFSMSSQATSSQAPVTFTSQISAPGYLGNSSSQSVNVPLHPQQVPQMSVQQQLQQQMQQQSQSSVIPSQSIDNTQVVTVGQQAPMTSTINTSSPLTQNVLGVTVVSQSQTQDNQHQLSAPMHSQNIPAVHIPPSQQVGQQQQVGFQQQTQNQQQHSIAQPPAVSQQQQMPSNQSAQQQQAPSQQLQSQPQLLQVQLQQQQQSIQSQTSDQMSIQQDLASGSQTSVGANYQPAQQSMPQAQLQQQQPHASPHMQQHSQQQHSISPSAAPSGLVGAPQSTVMTSTPSNYQSVTPNAGNPSNISSQISASNTGQLLQAPEVGITIADHISEALMDQQTTVPQPDDGSTQLGDEDRQR